MKDCVRTALCLSVSGVVAAALLAGCRSRFVEAAIENQGPAPLRLVEVDYPSASFGTGAIAADSTFHYRFKIQGTGPLKLEFTDDQGKVHDVDGPELREGQEGPLKIVIDPNLKVSWQPMFSPAK